MSWFTYSPIGSTSATEYSPVRRKIVFPTLTDNLKVGDWIHINISEYDIGRLFYYENGLIKDKVDQDSYLVVYEFENQYTPTYSLIVGTSSQNAYDKNLWFKSTIEVNAGQRPPGNYYIYYHKDNIQYIELSSGIYVSTSSPSGSNFIGLQSGSSSSAINFYSHEVKSDSTNNRVAGVSFLGNAENWFDQTSSTPGAKAIGAFSGPGLKIYGKKGPDYGKMNVKIIKTSAIGGGQQVISETAGIDLYSATLQPGQNIYTFDAISAGKSFTYAELYSDYIFEIEVMEEKNQSSSGRKVNIEKYSFSKNYNIFIEDEEIKPEITFKSVGGLK